LQEVAAARGRLLANVSHDLRQPAHAIGLLTERALLDPAGAPVRPILTDLQQLSQSLSASLSTLMDLTRLDAGLTQARMESIALNPLLQRLRLEYALMAQSKELDLSVSDTPVWVYSDPVLLHAVLANLLGNALKYTRRGQVTVEVIESGEEICVTVSDTGAGIESSQLNTIFKEFVRLDASKPGTEGLGLGLSIVQRYAALLGHRIDVHSEPGRGSRFGVSMQRVHVQAQTVSLLPLPDDQRLVGLRVLLVDNVPLLVTSLARTLAALGCQISTAESLDQALALEDIDRIEMVISDFHLGDREPDGLAVIDAMRSRRGRQSPLAALIITGDVSAELESRAAAAGVRIQHKPVRPQTLQRCMIEMLQGR
jgi:CheY-like chemotaxis protein